jgi:signal transduction histidine kinase
MCIPAYRHHREEILGWGVLHTFLTDNRTTLIDRCRVMVVSRSGPNPIAQQHGVPVFLDQLIETLAIEQTSEPLRGELISGTAGGSSISAVGEMATLHGRELLEQGFTIEQVVRDYGDICQAVTNLANEEGEAIAVDEFRTLNRCLDNAIAGAVTEYAFQQTAVAADGALQALNSRLGRLAHELRNYLHTADLAIKAIKMGSVGMSGATGAVLDRSVLGMRNLIVSSLAEVRVTAGLPPRFQSIKVADFLREVEATATLDSRARGCKLKVLPVDNDFVINADPEMLSAAVGNLLQNAFKFTMRNTEVRLRAYSLEDRILIGIEDHCGGLPTETAEKLLLPFVQNSDDRSGLGLGLDICRRNVEANKGVLRILNVPGSGCVFTIDLPRQADS